MLSPDAEEPGVEVPDAEDGGKRKKSSLFQLALNFDTTGSMAPCLRSVKSHVRKLIADIKSKYSGDVEFCISANGDYQDARSTYLFKTMGSFTGDANAASAFVSSTGSTCGYDAKEAYEHALREIGKYNWDPSATKILVFLSDDLPHEASYHLNVDNIDWKQECTNLARKGVQIYPVQCLNRRYATSFYEKMAGITGGIHLKLDQFSELKDILLAITTQQEGTLDAFEEELIASGRFSRSMNVNINRLRGSGRRRGQRKGGLRGRLWRSRACGSRHVPGHGGG